MKQRAVKMPDELWEQVKREAEKSGLTAGEFVRLAVEEKVGVVEEIHHHSPEDLRQLQAVKAKSAARVIQATTAERPFKCPTHGCEFRATSPAARCGTHGRVVVAA